MMTYSNELDESFLVKLDVLDLHLRRMSHGAHQYAAVPVPSLFKSGRGYPLSLLLLGYSNPESDSLENSLFFLNALCFVLPLVELGGKPNSEPELIVAFSSKSITALTQGLYMEDGEVMYDFLEDFNRVWDPIHSQLWPEDAASVVRTEDFESRGEVQPSLEEYLEDSRASRCRQDFVSFLETMARNREMICRAIE